MSYPHGDGSRRYPPGQAQDGPGGYMHPDGMNNFHPGSGHPQASQGFWQQPAQSPQQYSYGQNQHGQHQAPLSTQVLQNSHQQPGQYQQQYYSYYPTYDTVQYSAPQQNFPHQQPQYQQGGYQQQYSTHPQLHMQPQTYRAQQAYVEIPGPARSPPQPQAPTNAAQRYQHPQAQTRQPQQQAPGPPPARQTPQAPRRPSSNTASSIMGNQPSSTNASSHSSANAPSQSQVPGPTPNVNKNAPATYHTPRPQHPSPPTKQFTHVEIPVQRSSPSNMAPPMKRRKSNEGGSIAVRQVPQKGPSRPQTVKPELQPDIPRSIDYQATLLALAEEYSQLAYSFSKDIATERDMDDYQSLIYKAMCCLESVLQNTRLTDPRQEARIRLRLASMILDETENMAEAEDVLGKGILHCERNKFQDLKYAMQHMLIKVMFRTQPKAAFRSLERVIDEVTALKLYNWIYAFRFLRVSLGFDNHAETTILARHLAAVTAIADAQRNIAVKVVASALEALLHLRSGSPDAGQLAQRCLAAAHTHQLDPDMAQLGPVQLFVDMLRLAGQLIECKYDGIETALQDMQNSSDKKPSANTWSKNGTLFIPILPQSNSDIELDTAGLIKRLGNGDTALAFTWLPRSQLTALVYFLSGLARGQSNTADGKAERYYSECLKLVADVPNEPSRSYSAVSDRLDWQKTTNTLLKSYASIAACGRADWSEASKQLAQVITRLDAHDVDLDDAHKGLVLYIDAMIKQATGDLDNAHRLYKDPRLTFEPNSKTLTTDRDVRALACLNNILILRCMSSHDKIMAEMLLSTVEQYCVHHRNPAMNSAYRTVRATMESQDGIIQTKQNLQHAVTAARTSRSNRLMSVVMNIMTSNFFHNIVGDQAEKSASAGRSLATKSQDKLWIAVADRMLGDTYELMGKRANAMHVRLEAEHSLEGVPDAVRRKIHTMYDD